MFRRSAAVCSYVQEDLAVISSRTGDRWGRITQTGRPAHRLIRSSPTCLHLALSRLPSLIPLPLLNQVVMVKIARDYGHHKIFWELSDVDTRPPDSVLRQLYEVKTLPPPAGIAAHPAVSAIRICRPFFCQELVLWGRRRRGASLPAHSAPTRFRRYDSRHNCSLYRKLPCV